MEFQKKSISKCLNSNPCTNYWTAEDDYKLTEKALEFKAKNWKKIAQFFDNRSSQSCSFRWKKIKLAKYENIEQKFTKEQDELLLSLVEEHGEKWQYIQQFFESKSNKQIRERYLNKLRKDINKNKFTDEEDQQLYNLQQMNGNRWKLFGEIMNRSENNIKNRFYSYIIKNAQTTAFNDQRPEIEAKDFAYSIKKEDTNDEVLIPTLFINPDNFFADHQQQETSKQIC